MHTGSYRPEIDGLRAMAIVPVVIYHAFPDALPGGFVGVDIFFVISGYLITQIIAREIAKGSFSLWEFYDRRARRILPALLFVLAATLPFAWRLLPNEELLSFFESLAGTALFASNVVFFYQNSYFGVESSSKPLLHTWSLAIEEQFYILFPLYLLLLHKFCRKHLLLGVAAAFALSLALSAGLTAAKPEASFYLLPTRFWELGAGALLALSEERLKLHTSAIYGWAGATLIGISFFFISTKSVFPGIVATLPVAGAVLTILGARAGNSPARFLSSSPMRGIGLISYSLYLWHWPVLVLGSRMFIKGPDAWESMILISVSVLLAWFSWKFVEAPFRKTGRFPVKRVVLVSATVLTLVFCASLYAFETKAGWQRRTSSGMTTAQLDRLRWPNYGLNRCDDATKISSDMCSSAAHPHDAVLWGDSFAMHLAQALQHGSRPLKFVQITRAACGPFVGLAYFGGNYGKAWGLDCIAFNEAAFQYILRSDVTKVIIASNFTLLDSDARMISTSSELIEAGTRGRDTLVNSIKQLKAAGKSVLLVSPMPTPNFDIADCIARAVFMNSPTERCDFEVSKDRRARGYKLLQDVASRSEAKLLIMRDLSCPGGYCMTSIEGMPLYRDSSHMNAIGSAKFGDLTDFSGKIRALLE